MRLQRAFTGALALALASCASTPPFQIASSPAGGYCARLDGHFPPDQVRPQLLLSSAEAVLASGYRYFRVTAYSESGQPAAPISPRANTTRHGRLCLDVLSGPGPSGDVYDSVQVVQEAPPALERGLNPTAGGRLLRPRSLAPPPGA